MSGHSKWSKIKRAKESADAKKGKIFGKLAKEIQIAARDGGADPNQKNTLREAIARAKQANMPQANIDRLLDEKDTQKQIITYEGFGPGGSALLIVAETDNPNRTVATVRTILKNIGGSLGTRNSVQWKFNQDMQPQYPVQLSEDDQMTLRNAIKELKEDPDIIQVYTDGV